MFVKKIICWPSTSNMYFLYLNCRYEDVNLITKSISSEAQTLMIFDDQFLDLTQSVKNDPWTSSGFSNTLVKTKNIL